MKKKTYAALIAALTISGAFLLNGCSFDLPNQDTQVSTGAELSTEKETLTDGELQLYTRWYGTDGQKLAGATIAIYDGNEKLFEGTTDENGNLEMCTIPGNTELRCTVTDASGDEIAKSDILYKISDSYDNITVYTTHGESGTQKVEVPSSKATLSAAIYVTDNKTLSHANITEYIADDQTQADTTDGTDGAADAANGDAAATDGQADANATDAAQQPADGTAADGQADAATQSTDQGADQAQTQPADQTQQPVVTQ